MDKIDVSKLSIKCGLEIHQQLEGKKLFCNCSTKIQEKAPDYTIKRKLRAVIGETGEIDVAAAQESAKGKTFIYECYDENVCLVDLDEAPPNEINKSALRAAIQVSRLLNARIVDEIQVMRKTVVDGSNTTGFQRSALIARNGWIDTSFGRVGIPTISLEEDSGRLIKEDAQSTTFRLDRLGIPLIEIGTSADITTPEQCLEVASYLGMILRSTGVVKRGLGTIRQDVNVSILDGERRERIEIKGAQDLKLLPVIVATEAVRQKKLLELRSELTKIQYKSSPFVDVSSVFSLTVCDIVKNAVAQGKRVLAVKLDGFAGMLGRELQPNKRFGTELSDRAKVVSGVRGLFHSDEVLGSYGITIKEIDEIRKRLNCDKKSAFVLIADSIDRAELALKAVQQRVSEVFKGIPREVRRANEDGTTSYLRPMPGAARLYPETDVVPVRATKELLAVKLPERLDQKTSRYEKKFGLSRDLARDAAKDCGEFFEFLVKKHKTIKPAYIAEVLVSSPKEIKRDNPKADISKIKEEHHEVVFSALERYDIVRESVVPILSDVALGKPLDLAPYKTISDEQLEKSLGRIIEENKLLPINAMIGRAMQELRGKATGEKIVNTIKKLVSQKFRK